MGYPIADLGHVASNDREIDLAAILADISVALARARHGVEDAKGISRTTKAAFVCGARTRKGTPCQAKPMPGRRRCRNQGGATRDHAKTWSR